MVPRHIATIFADDIRQEVGNKITIVGIYTTVMLVESFPAVLPKLCIHSTIVTPIERPFQTLSARLMLGDTVLQKHDIVTAEIPFKAPERLATGREARAHSVLGVFVLAPLSIEEPTCLELIADADGEEIHGARLHFDLMDSDLGRQIIAGGQTR